MAKSKFGLEEVLSCSQSFSPYCALRVKVTGLLQYSMVLNLLFPFARDVKAVSKVAVGFMACVHFNLIAHDGK